MKFTEKDIDLIEECLDYYLSNKERFVSYDECMESKTKIQKLLYKIHQLDKEDEVKTVDAEPVKHGHWIYGLFTRPPMCSVCKKLAPTTGYMFDEEDYSYCPKCGAPMD